MGFWDAVNKGLKEFNDKAIKCSTDQQLFKNIATATSSLLKEKSREELEKRGYSSYEIDEKVSEYLGY